MKTSATTISFMVLMFVIPNNDDAYEKAMKDAMLSLNQAGSVEEFHLTANKFDRIGKAAGDNWLPLYHAAYAKVMMAAMEQEPAKKDPFLDAAQRDLDKMEKLEHDTAERLVLQGFLYMISMSVDATRGMTMGQQCAMVLNQAYTMDDHNPRAVLMLGQFKHGSATYMGADTSEACSMFEEALQLFEQEEGEKRSDLLPHWGKDFASMMQQECGQ